MRFTISGFGGASKEGQETPAAREAEPVSAAPRKSVVQVCFPETGRSLAYYNDRFDLKAGDRVYVSGKLEGVLGIVTSVNYNFRIRLSEYQKVIFQVNTRVHGRFYISASHFITFDPAALPAAQVTSWFRAPVGEGEEFASGNDDFSFSLEHLEEMKVTNAIAERGHDYFMENRVRYLCLDGTKGYAVVEGTKAYAVEFRYHDGEIQNLLCDCFCSYPCKHEFAAMLQLKETLGHIAKHYAHEYEQTGYFAAIAKETFFAFAISNCQEGGFSLGRGETGGSRRSLPAPFLPEIPFHCPCGLISTVLPPRFS